MLLLEETLILLRVQRYKFFFPLGGNTIFWYEWINDQRPCPRKKNTVTLKPFCFFLSEILCVKIKSLAWKKSFLCAWKFTPNTWKLKKKSTWKSLPVRENFGKSVREKQLPYVKKMKKTPKNRFTHTFYFHVVKKKHCVSLLYRMILQIGLSWLRGVEQVN